jgi:hypothetical protein
MAALVKWRFQLPEEAFDGFSGWGADHGAIKQRQKKYLNKHKGSLLRRSTLMLFFSILRLS